MQFFLIIIMIGMAAGFFAGQFGVGGAFLMQPALRLVLHTPKLVTIGTPIPVIVVSSLTGAYNYYRNGYVDVRTAVFLAASGMVGAVFGSLTTGFVNGSILLMATAVILAITSARFILDDRRNRNNVGMEEDAKVDYSKIKPAGKTLSLSVGAVVGFLTGLLGLGGGYILIPTLTIIFKRNMKTAIGTSLFVIIAYAVPGTITHFRMGHVDLLITLFLAIGVIPGAYFGSKIAIGLPEKVLRRSFGIFLFTISVYFGLSEIRNIFI